MCVTKIKNDKKTGIKDFVIGGGGGGGGGWRKKLFFLTTHLTHFLYGYMASDIIMVKHHWDNQSGNPLLFQLAARDL